MQFNQHYTTVRKPVNFQTNHMIFNIDTWGPLPCKETWLILCCFISRFTPPYVSACISVLFLTLTTCTNFTSTSFALPLLWQVLQVRLACLEQDVPMPGGAAQRLMEATHFEIKNTEKSETRKHWKQRSPCNMRIWYRENIWKIRSDVLLCNTMYEYTSVVLWILWAKISPSGHRSAKLTTSWRGHIAALVTLLQKSPILQLFCRSTFTSCDNIWQHFRTALRSLSKCHQIPIGFVCIAA